jgi:hypothetical protein
MNMSFGNVTYRTERFEDAKAGCAGLNLFATGQTTAVSTITFWDAAGQFFLKINGLEIPLEVVERFIAEAKQQILIS